MMRRFIPVFPLVAAVLSACGAILLTTVEATAATPPPPPRQGADTSSQFQGTGLVSFISVQRKSSVFSTTSIINRNQQNRAPSPLSMRTSQALLHVRGGSTAVVDSEVALLGNDSMQVAVISATAVSLIHGLIDMSFPGAVCQYYKVPLATSAPGLVEMLIRRIGTLLFATGLVAYSVFLSNNNMGWPKLPTTLDQAVAVVTFLFWLESTYSLVNDLPRKVDFDVTATWTNLVVTTIFLGLYYVGFSADSAAAVVPITKWIIRLVLAHGVLAIIAPSAVLAIGGFPPPRKNQDLAVVLGVTRAAGYWSVAFAMFALLVRNNTSDLTTLYLRGFAYSRLVILFRSMYMNFASKEVYTSLRLKQAFWLVYDVVVAAVLSQSFFWEPTPASVAAAAEV